MAKVERRKNELNLRFKQANFFAKQKNRQTSFIIHGIDRTAALIILNTNVNDSPPQILSATTIALCNSSPVDKFPANVAHNALLSLLINIHLFVVGTYLAELCNAQLPKETPISRDQITRLRAAAFLRVHP